MRSEAGGVLVSVVVPTCGRPELLGRCLAALGMQQFPGDMYEVIVCDDGASAATEAQVTGVALSWDGLPALRYLAVHETRGPAGARNAGWRAARGSLIAFTDDDTIPAPDWVGQGVRALTPDVAALSGATSMPLPDPPTDYERDASGLTRSEFITANCFVRRSALQQVGGFDPRFTMAWREDSDLHFALITQGMRVLRAPLARVEHPYRPVPFLGGLRMQKKVLFDGLLYRKHPDLFRTRIRSSPPWFYFVTCAAFVTALALSAAALARMQGPMPAAFVWVVWLALTGMFFVRRLRGTARRPRDVLDLLITSACIPVLATFWRIVGMLRFGRVYP
ncbi:glycosyl transferase family 2 [Bordetella genomosp. 5]|uniref:glycosyltransferase family 2 protein n=1 Tax=Bordetella genomosp. 5 TaxID=1395608 RepID=UPI000B9EE634|nr:glycosyltransferase family A protein [Bordetella genomosp. 5]OZI43767.1 glycosyl transferase family 2 [Bordetella genomosp. 5]